MDHDTRLGEELMQVASEGREADALALLARGARADYVAKIGDMTPLMMAGQCGLPRLALALIENGANPSRVDKKGRGALRYAAPLGHPGIFELLAPLAPCGPDIFQETPLQVAAAAGRLEAVRALVGWSDLESKMRLGWTAAGLAAINGQASCLRALLQAGARRDSKTDGGETLLMAAARGGSLECLALAFSEEAASELDATGRCALDVALEHGKNAAADWLALKRPHSAAAQKALAACDSRLPGLLAWGQAQALREAVFGSQEQADGREEPEKAKRI